MITQWETNKTAFTRCNSSLLNKSFPYWQRPPSKNTPIYSLYRQTFEKEKHHTTKEFVAQYQGAANLHM
ncbi:hypothetical protein, partial [Pseudoalteromonas sp.]|uniref:hypothetical protein n=1 Tax=Pseudoalteromonas sp. TaxID=53249 RepID=UPI0026195330